LHFENCGLQHASALTRRFRLFRFLYCSFVIPAAAAQSHIGGGGIEACLCVLMATRAESRAAPGRELVDPGGPMIQIRVHRYLHWSRIGLGLRQVSTP
jgi:hypothetical protein